MTGLDLTGIVVVAVLLWIFVDAWKISRTPRTPRRMTDKEAVEELLREISAGRAYRHHARGR